MNQTPQEFEDVFWQRVILSLTDFHQFKLEKAQTKVSKFRKNFPAAETFDDLDMIYHASPFEIACDIAGQRLALTEFKAHYENILELTDPLEEQVRVIAEGVPFLEETTPPMKTINRQPRNEPTDWDVIFNPKVEPKVKPVERELATAGTSGRSGSAGKKAGAKKLAKKSARPAKKVDASKSKNKRKKTTR